MTLTRVTAPVGPLVPEALLRTHLRVDGVDDTALLFHYEAAAHAWLDGQSGVLGRAILLQTWEETFDGWGEVTLALPDVVANSIVVSLDATGSGTFAAGGSHVLTRVGSQTCLKLDGPAAQAVKVTYACEMPAGQRAKAVQIALLMIGTWYQNREAVVVGTIASELPMAARALVRALAWAKV